MPTNRDHSNVTGHETFNVAMDALGRVHLTSKLPAQVSMSRELWTAVEHGAPWAVVAGDLFGVRTVETVFVYRRISAQTDGKRVIYVCDLVRQWSNLCVCQAQNRPPLTERHSMGCPEAQHDWRGDLADTLAIDATISRLAKAVQPPAE